MPLLHLNASRIAGPDACANILLVGEDNPLHSDPHYALYYEPRGCSGNRLQSKILGLSPRRSYLPIWRTNLCVGGWDRAAAVDRAALLVGTTTPWNVVVMLGAKVGDAFRRATRHTGIDDPFTQTLVTGYSLMASVGLRVGDPPVDTTFVMLPHPSGRNTPWNDKDRVDQARALLRVAAPAVPWGEV